MIFSLGLGLGLGFANGDYFDQVGVRVRVRLRLRILVRIRIRLRLRILVRIRLRICVRVRVRVRDAIAWVSPTSRAFKVGDRGEPVTLSQYHAPYPYMVIWYPCYTPCEPVTLTAALPPSLTLHGSMSSHTGHVVIHGGGGMGHAQS